MTLNSLYRFWGKIIVLFEPERGGHLFETPLTSDQSLVLQEDGRLLLEATIADTQGYVGG